MSRRIDGSFRELAVRRQIEEAVVVVRKNLDATRNPQHPADVPHTYDDKFRIVELASSAALTAQLNTLSAGLGLNPGIIAKLQEARGKKTVSLRFSCNTSSTFKETKTREEESATRHEKQGVFGKTTWKSVTTITEHYWNYHVSWKVEAVVGTGAEFQLVLLERTGKHVIMTRGKERVNPLSEKRSFDPQETEITWLLNQCSSEGSAKGNVDVEFNIDRRDATKCHTPRRNEEVGRLLENTSRFGSWCSSVQNQVKQAYNDGYSQLLPLGQESPNFSVINDNVFIPVAVMLALEPSDTSGNGNDNTATSEASPASLLSSQDFAEILSQQQADLQTKFVQMKEVLPGQGVVTTVEAGVVVSLGYSVKLWRQYSHAVQAVEQMLMNQLIAAIGKRIGPDDFAKYVVITVYCQIVLS